jgi:ankyrin repeat protein
MSAGQPSEFAQITKPSRRARVTAAAGLAPISAAGAAAAVPGGGNGNTPIVGANAGRLAALAVLDVKGAMDRGDTATLEEAIDLGYDFNRALPNDRTPFEYSIDNYTYDYFPILVRGGADINRVSPTSHYTPLGYAIQTGSSAAIEPLLASGAKVDIFVSDSPLLMGGQENVLPFHLAILNNSEAILDKFLSAGVDVNRPLDANGLEFPLEVAIVNGKRRAFRRLLDQPGLNLEPFKEKALNYEYPDIYNKAILEKLGNPPRQKARDIPSTITMYLTPSFQGAFPEIGEDKLIQELVPADQWAAAGPKLVKSIDDNLMCGYALGEEYIKTLLKSRDKLDFVLLVKRKDTGEHVGICMCKFKDSPPQIYIDIICAKQKYSGFGPLMLEKVKALQKFYKRPHVVLNSVPEKVDFYASQGFIRRPAENVTRSLMRMRYNNMSQIPPPPGGPGRLIPPPPPGPPPPLPGSGALGGAAKEDLVSFGAPAKVGRGAAAAAPAYYGQKVPPPSGPPKTTLPLPGRQGFMGPEDRPVKPRRQPRPPPPPPGAKGGKRRGTRRKPVKAKRTHKQTRRR